MQDIGYFPSFRMSSLSYEQTGVRFMKFSDFTISFSIRSVGPDFDKFYLYDKFYVY